MRWPVILLAALAPACGSSAPTSDAGTPASRFPESWLGTWEGAVAVARAEGPGEGFTMRREIARTEDADRYDWITTYSGLGQEQVRRYELVTIDAARGAYAIDENNGIVLEARLLDDTLLTQFDIGGSRLLVRERLAPDGAALLFEIVAGPAEPEPGAGPAASFPPTTLQRARLSRVEEPSAG